MADKELKAKIADEIENLERLVKEMNSIKAKIKKEPDFLEVRAAGSILHDFYCGTEKIFERIALAIDNNLPKGEDCHRQLLFQMGKSLKGKRNRIISEDLMRRLKEYLRFRHLFRHIYGFELKWDRIKPLCINLENLLNQLRREINKFLKILD